MLHGLVGSGSRLKSESLGPFRDFCPICREMKGFTATSYFTQRHVRIFLLIQIETGREGGVGVAQCTGCGSRWVLGPGARRPVRSRAETDRCAARVGLEERARAGTLTPEERSALLLEPFPFMAAMLSTERAIGEADRLSA